MDLTGVPINWDIIPKFILSFDALLIIYLAKSVTKAKVKIQSELCTAEEMRQKIQCFREVPDTRYDVLVRQSITMRCKVEFQHGRVQWRVQNLMMGFDRAIPARPRLRVTGRPGFSEYHLTIEPVVLGDTGEYECQVEPVLPHHPPLRRRTRLRVYEYPSKPRLLYNTDDVSTKDILIPDQTTSQLNRSVVKCLSSGGVPSPSFHWLVRRGPPFPIGKDNLTTLASLATSRDSSILPLTFAMNGSGKRENVISDQGQGGEDTIEVECRVTNGAMLLFTKDTQPSFLSTSVRFLMEKKPGRPQIRILDPHAVAELHDLILDCLLNPQSRPAATLQWSWATNSAQWRVPTPLKRLQHLALTTVLDNNPVSIRSRLRLPTVPRAAHGAKIECRVLYQGRIFKSTSIKLLIPFKPDQLRLTSLNGTTLATAHRSHRNQQQHRPAVLSLVEHQSRLISCSTSGYYGNLSLDWRVYDVAGRISESLAMALVYNVSAVRYSLPNDRVRSVSSVQFTPDYRHHSSLLVCSVGIVRQLAVAIQIEVFYLPTVVTLISSYSAGESYLKVEDFIEIQCYVKDGNPVPTIDIMIDDEVLRKFTLPKREITAKIPVQRRFNSRHIFCRAHSLVHQPGLWLDSRRMVLALALLPDKVTLAVHYPAAAKEGAVEEGQRQSVSCLARNSNPEPVIGWRLRLCHTMSPQGGLRSANQSSAKGSSSGDHGCQLQEMKAADTQSRTHMNGSYTESNIVWQPTWLYHKAVIMCLVYNPFFSRKVITRKIQVQVIFQPKIFVRDLTSNFILVHRSTSRNLTIDIVSNPPLQNASCVSCEDDLVFGNRGRVEYFTEWILKLENVSYSKTFIILAQNSIGTTRLNIHVRLAELQSYVTENHTEFAVLSLNNNVLHCQPPYQQNPSISWSIGLQSRTDNTSYSLGCNQGYREGNNPNHLVKYFAKCTTFTSSLIFFYISASDEGRFSCQTHHDGQIVYQLNYHVSVLVAPVLFLAWQKPHKIACVLNQSCSLFCFYRTVGSMTVTWSRLDLLSSFKQSLSRTNLTVNVTATHLTSLRLANVTQESLGIYAVKVTNDLYETELQLQLVEPSAPDCPKVTRVRSINGSRWLMVVWSPIFSGGLDTSFTIHWRRLGDETNDRLGRSIATRLQQHDDDNGEMHFIIPGLDRNDNHSLWVESQNSLGKCKDPHYFSVTLQSTELASTEPRTPLGPVTSSDGLNWPLLAASSISVMLSLVFISLLILLHQRQHRNTSSTSLFRAPKLSGRRQRRFNAKNRFVSCTNRLYSDPSERQKDLSMIFSNQRASITNEPAEKKMESCDTSEMNISDYQ